MLRVAVIGARRERQGIGFHLARFAAEAGAEVVGVLGTRPESAGAARRALEQVGVEPRAYVDLHRMLDAEQPDVLVVASPSRTHEAYLGLALDAGLHVLCEKPLCWGGEQPAARARELATAFQAAGLHLGVNTQWPFTLDTYRELYPKALCRTPSTFFMRLSPRSRGDEMLPDALPHALSLLRRAVPGGDVTIEAPSVRVLSTDGTRVEVAFVYRVGDAGVEARVDLRTTPEPPRPAAYGFGGCVAERRVELEGYRLSLEGGGRRRALPDPTPRLVRSFLSRVSSSAVPLVHPDAWPGMAHLQALHAAWPADAGGSSVPGRTDPTT